MTNTTPTSSFQVQNAKQLSEYIYATSIAGLYYIQHKVAQDDRGFYAELARLPELHQLKQAANFQIKQINLSYSLDRVTRGMHAENWNKLATPLTGSCFCALADIRPDSPTFAQTETFLFSADALQGSLFIAPGIANSFCVLEGPVQYLYSVDQLYSERDTSGDRAISLFDPQLAIAWPLKQEEMIISDRDRSAITLAELTELAQLAQPAQSAKEQQ